MKAREKITCFFVCSHFQSCVVLTAYGTPSLGTLGGQARHDWLRPLMGTQAKMISYVPPFTLCSNSSSATRRWEQERCVFVPHEIDRDPRFYCRTHNALLLLPICCIKKFIDNDCHVNCEIRPSELLLHSIRHTTQISKFWWLLAKAHYGNQNKSNKHDTSYGCQHTVLMIASVFDRIHSLNDWQKKLKEKQEKYKPNTIPLIPRTFVQRCYRSNAADSKKMRRINYVCAAMATGKYSLIICIPHIPLGLTEQIDISWETASEKRIK